MKIVQKTYQWFRLFILAVWVQLFNFLEFVQLCFLYYPFSSFFKVDLYLTFLYLWKSPFKVAKVFALKQGEDPYAYGETALISLGALLKKIGISKEDCFFELGCGSARSCFFVRQVFGCRVVGVDWNPCFIEKAKKAKETFEIEKIKFLVSDFSFLDFSDATIVYLYGTCLDAKTINRLITSLRNSVKKDCKIVTVSFALNHYLNEEVFEVEEIYSVGFVWGKAEVFVQTLKQKN
jgi:SAM-dependent methyltransferase